MRPSASLVFLPMTLPLWSADGVFLVQVREDIIVLDANADHYACLIDAAGWLAVSPDGSLQVADETSARALLSAGLAQQTPPIRPRRTAVPAAHELTFLPRVTPTQIVRAGVQMAAATLAFRGRTFPRLLRSARGAASRPSSIAPFRVGQSVAAFRAALPWLPLEGECLQRAFQLRRVLMSRGTPVDWIFGVRTWPFAAHCWLQIEDTVVGDSLSRVSSYTPIMAA